MTYKAAVIGAGLAGCEAAWFLANAGINVTLYEMKPLRFSPAHHYNGFAELVCSNSLKANRIESAAGLLKEEMRMLGSIVIEAAEKNSVPAGGALAVNREDFSDYITEKIKSHKNITVIAKEITELPVQNAIIATGPLTGGEFAKSIQNVCGDYLSFYDAAAPIVTFDSINMDKAFFAARYDRGGADYINCPLSREEYEEFFNALVTAQTADLSEFDITPESPDITVYEGCMPVEILAKRGIDSVRYGCMKPVGLVDPRTGKRPYAAVQLRKENTAGTMYNIVGFQTNLKFSEQKRVFSMIPGLENAEFSRYGVMHRNTFLDSPKLLDKNFRLKKEGFENVYFAGQITGTEGYTESAAGGICAAVHLANRLLEKPDIDFPETTMCGALASYISSGGTSDFQPMGANMGILPPLNEKIRSKQDRYMALAQRSIHDLKNQLNKEVNI